MSLPIMTHRVAYLLVLMVAVSVNAYAQTTEQNVNVTIKPSQTVEERVADSIREKQLREAAEEKRAAEKSAEIASKEPTYIAQRGEDDLRNFRYFLFRLSPTGKPVA